MHEANIEANVALFYEAWNRGDLDTMMPMFAPNAVDHNSETGEDGSQSMMKSLVTLRNAFPDLQYKVHEIAIDAKRQIATSNVTCEGTHEREYLDVPPSGRHVSWREMRMGRWHEGRVVEHWTVSEVYGALCALQKSTVG